MPASSAQCLPHEYVQAAAFYWAVMQLCCHAQHVRMSPLEAPMPMLTLDTAFNTLSRLTAIRPFSSSTSFQNWLAPKAGYGKKDPKGRPRVHTGGSTRGTTVVWGDYGIRMKDHDRRISADQLRIAEETIKRRLRGTHYTLYKRVAANIGVYTSGNESRMGKGKGSFDHWATRVAVSKIVFELRGDVHEQVVRDAFRLAGNKLPGKFSRTIQRC